MRLLKHLVLFQESIVADLANMRVFERLIEIDNELSRPARKTSFISSKKAASWSSEVREKLADQGVYKLIESTLKASNPVGQVGVLEAVPGQLADYNATETDMRTMRELVKAIVELLSPAFTASGWCT